MDFGRRDQVRLAHHHWFAGSGMAHGLRLRGGKAEWFRSRFVLDRNAARVLSRKPLSGPSEGTRDGNVNTNLMNVGGTHDYGRGRMTAEPVFVRKAGATAEDEGWIMSYVYDPERDARQDYGR